MALKTYKFNSLDEMNRFLAGTLVGKPLPSVVYGLVGTKVKFVQPDAVEYTFVEGDRADGGLTFAEIKSQLEGAVSGLLVTQVDRGIAFTSVTAAGVELAEPGDPKGHALLGFSDEGGSKTLVYGAPGTPAPCLVQAFGVGTQIAVIVEEPASERE
jgi:hypothetical protein